MTRGEWLTVAELVFWIVFGIVAFRINRRQGYGWIAYSICCLIGLGIVLWLVWIRRRLGAVP